MVVEILLPLAHHPALVAIPFVVPVLVLGGSVLALSLRERRRREQESQGED